MSWGISTLPGGFNLVIFTLGIVFFTATVGWDIQDAGGMTTVIGQKGLSNLSATPGGYGVSPDAFRGYQFLTPVG
jgi:hypothetical protein